MVVGRKSNPLPVLVGCLTYQVSGWVMGKRIFDGFNAEAMLFTFLVGSVVVFGWIFLTMTSWDSSKSCLKRRFGIGLIVISVVVGVGIRLAI